MKKIKQVIVVRKDLKMRRGKEIAQGAHASMMFLLKRMKLDVLAPGLTQLVLNDVEIEWAQTGFTKITVTVNSLEELLGLQKQAQEAGLEAHIIEDMGLTEFNGVLTPTALAIGPDLSEKIDPVTSHLTLY